MTQGYYYYSPTVSPGYRLTVTKRPGGPNTIILDLPQSTTLNVQRGDRIDLSWVDEDGTRRHVEGDVYFKRRGRLHVNGYATTEVPTNG